MSLFEACDVRWPMQAFVSSAFHRCCCDNHSLRPEQRCGHWQQQMDLKALALDNNCRSIFKFHLIHFSFFFLLQTSPGLVSLKPFHWSFQTAVHSGCCFSFIPVKNTYCEAPLWKTYMHERTSWQMHLNASLKWPVDGKLSRPKWVKEWDIILRTIIMMMGQREAGNINRLQRLFGSERSLNKVLNVSRLRFCHSSEGSLFFCLVFLCLCHEAECEQRSSSRRTSGSCRVEHEPNFDVKDVNLCAVMSSASLQVHQELSEDIMEQQQQLCRMLSCSASAPPDMSLSFLLSESVVVNLLRTWQQSSLRLFSQQKEKV